MIYDSLEQFNEYLSLHTQFQDVQAFLTEEPLASRADGLYEINDCGAFCVVEDYDTQTFDDCFIECHRKYIDVQVVISGMERMGICHKVNCASDVSYDEEKDFEKLKGALSFIDFTVGSFFVFFPEDAHMPKVKCGDKIDTVRKVVFKIPVSLK